MVTLKAEVALVSMAGKIRSCSNRGDGFGLYQKNRKLQREGEGWHVEADQIWRQIQTPIDADQAELQLWATTWFETNPKAPIVSFRFDSTKEIKIGKGKLITLKNKSKDRQGRAYLCNFRHRPLL